MLNNSSSRPSLSRNAASQPLYQRRQASASSSSSSSLSANVDFPADSNSMRLATMPRLDENAYRSASSTLSSTGDTIRRSLASSEVVASASSSRASSVSAPQGLYTPPYSPPSSSSSSCSTHQAPKTPRVMSPYLHDIPNQTYFTLPQSAMSPNASLQPSLPSITSNNALTNLPPALKLRQSQSQLNVKMEIESHQTHYALLAPLGDKFTADGITISAKRNNVLLIVADRWDQEKDCHVEWEVTLDRDADMSNVHAQFTNGLLKVTVKRR